MHQPTAEQAEAVELFRTGDSLALIATAGSGKTRTIQFLGEACPDRRGIVTAFNRAIIDEASRRMPPSIRAATMHSLAFRAVGHRFKHRLNSPRMRSTELARRLRLDPLVIKYDGATKVMAASYLAGLVMRSIDLFCQTADEDPAERHVPYVDGIDEPTPDGSRTWANNRDVRAHILPAMRRAWADLSNPDGVLKYSHSHYLKTFALGRPQLACDFLAIDEFQDLNGLMLGVVGDQISTQIVGVGDPAQMINEWMGSRDGFAEIDFAQRSFLTRSFRFGEGVAVVANGLLSRLGAECRVIGGAQWDSTVGPVAHPDLILTRTNAKAVETVLELQDEGRTAYLMGGGADVVAFARAAKSLMHGERTSHFELACFENWAEVRQYCDADEQGGDLRLLVNLVDRYGPDVIVASLANTTPEADAEVVVSTAHRMKGREADRVRVAGDFMPPRPGEGDLCPSELRLAYVAVTRARHELDLSAVPHFLAAPYPAHRPVLLQA